MKTLEERIQHLEDLEAIRRLKHYYYCLCVDASVGGDLDKREETLSRFADDMVADFTGFPVAEGKAAVSAFYAEGVPGMLSWCQHRVMNEVIEINGDSAKAVWYIDCPGTFRAENPLGIPEGGTGFIGGRYEEEYIREDGVWKWKKITALLDVVKPFESNWAGAERVNKNR